MQTIAVANSKGGSAKTTTAVHLAVGLAQAGQRVLLLDLDPQGHVAEALGVSPGDEDTATITTVLRRTAALAAAVVPHATGVDLVLATEELAYFEPELLNALNREYRLKAALASVSARYDYSIIDCPPYLNFLTINAFAAAGAVLVPMVAEYLALKGVARLLQYVYNVAVDINPHLAVRGILPTRVGHTVNAREVVAAARTTYGEVVPVLPTPIPETVKFREAMGLGVTIYAHSPDSPGAQAYQALVQEVLHG